MSNEAKRLKEIDKAILREWYANGYDTVAAYKKYRPDSTKASAISAFSRLKRSNLAKAYIAELEGDFLADTQATQISIRAELERWVNADLTDYIALSASELKELPLEMRRLITKCVVTTKKKFDKEGNELGSEERVEIALASKEKAIEMLARHVNFYGDIPKESDNGITLTVLNEEQAKIIKDLRDGKLHTDNSVHQDSEPNEAR